MRSLEEAIQQMGKPGPFQAIPCAQDLGRDLFITTMFEDGPHYGTEINPHVVLYRSLDDDRIMGCAVWVMKDAIITP